MEPRILFSADGLSALLNTPLDVDQDALALDTPSVLPPDTPEHHAATATPDVSPEPAMRSELVVIDSRVADYQRLVDDIQTRSTSDAWFEIIVLNKIDSGISQITELLAQRQDVSAVHIVSHGADGGVQLGADWVDSQSLRQQAEALALWKAALTDNADVLVYGCDVAEGSAGHTFIQELAHLTGADVAASSNLTGSSALGGDWVLEEHIGFIDTPILLSGVAQGTWSGTLVTYTVSNLNDSGAGSLRDAIAQSNASTTVDDTIVFSTSGTINLASTLTISDTVNINASSGGVPSILLDGNNLGTEAFVLTASADNSTIRGFVIRDFNADAIAIDPGSDGHTITGNYIGSLTLAGASAGAAEANSLAGIYVQGSNITISNNVISGNTWSGIEIDGAVTGTVISGNRIGVLADGVTALGNGQLGIYLHGGAANNMIGGTAAGAGNIVAYSGQTGVGIDADGGSGNAILGNSIYGNGTSGNYLGINLNGGTQNGFAVTANDVGDGDTGPNALQNYPALTSANSNSAGTTIAGTLNSDANTTYRIEFFANRPSVLDPSGHGEGERYLGFFTVTTDGLGNASFNSTLSNIWVNSGDRITATATVQTAGPAYGSTSEFAANVTATATGIVVVDTTSDVADGTTTSIAALGAARGADGLISLREAIIAANNTANGVGGADRIYFQIAGTGVHTINVASALPGINEAVAIDASTDDSFFANGSHPAIILDGNNAFTGDGLVLATGSGGSTIRGLVIRDFSGDGIQIDVGSNGNTISGNYIGSLNELGTTAGTGERNTQMGLRVSSSGNTIGGTGGADGNVISGNTQDGIYLNATTNNLIIGNYIGVTRDGTTALANASNGIEVFGGSTHQIGQVGAGNVISGNGFEQLYLNGSSGNRVQGNSIGPAVSGTAAPTGYAGEEALRIDGNANNNLIGGTAAGQGNVIAYTGLVGVYVGSGAGNAILGNSIHSNTASAGTGNSWSGLGIDLGAQGVQANDAGDIDTGSNDLQNFPVLSAAGTDGSKIAISGSINSAANATLRLEFYANATGDPSGYGEGQTYLGYATVVTDGSGNASFVVSFTRSVTAGHAISATATVMNVNGTYGSTSEFAANVSTAGALIVDTTADIVDGTTTNVANLLANKGADGKISLREAIIATNNTAGQDTIFLSAGTYTLTRTGSSENLASTGDLDILQSLTLVGGGASSTIVNATGLNDRVFELSGTGTSAYLSGITVTGGNTSSGSGILANGSTSLTLWDSVIANNTITGTTGGGLYTSGTTFLNNVTVSGNSGASGAGIYSNNTLVISNSTITGNTGSNQGAGIWSSGGSANLSLINTTISGNSNSGNGGGLYNGGAAMLVNVTISGNTAAAGGGLYRGSGSVTTTLLNTIVAGNTAGSALDVSGAITSMGTNLIGNTAGSSGWIGTDLQNVNPLLNALASNGGGTQTMSLQAASPAINVGSATAAPMVDQRGYFRDGSIDIGAYEFNGTNPLGAVPQNTVPSAQSTNEDVNLVFSSANGNVISIADADAGSTSLEVTVSVTNGALTLAGTTGLTFASGDGAADTAMTFRGTLANINTALNGLSYAPALNYNGGATLTISTLDSVLTSLNIDANLQGWYEFSGNTNDTGPGIAQNATLFNGAALTTDGLRGQVLTLDGVDDYARITGTFSNPTEITIGGWVNMSVAGAVRREFISLDDRVHIALNDGGLGVKGSVQVGAASWIDLTSGQTLAAGSWHHVMYTYSDAGNLHKLYIDGVQVASATIASSIYWTGAGDTYIGRHPLGIHSLAGQVDDVRIYNRALNSSEIAGLAADLPLRDTDSVAITVNPVNDAPTANIIPTTYAATEQVAMTLHGTGLSIADVDAGAAAVRATLSVTSGILNAAAGATGVTVSGSGTATVTLDGTLTQINNLLAGSLSGTVTYTANTDTPPASATLTLIASDLGNTGAGGILTGNDTAIIGIGAVNDAPVNTVPGAQSTNEDTNLVFSSGNGNQIVVADVDAGGNPVEVTLSVTNGALTLAGTAGLTFMSGDGTADSTMTFRGTVANINAALNGLTYIPTAEYSGGATLTMASSDNTLVSLNLDANLQARYTFEGNANDVAPGTMQNGTLVGDAAYSNNVTRGQVISLGGNGAVQIGGLFGNPVNVTLAAWVNLSVADTNGADVISLGDSVALRLDANINALNGFIYDGSTWQFTGNTVYLATTGWHHVAYSFDDASNLATLYLDGVAVASSVITSSISYTLGADTFIGRHGNGSTAFDFNGLIDDARIYDRALAASEIASLANDLALTDTDTVALTVNPVNDAPTSTIVPVSYAATEQVALTLHGTGLSIADVDAGAAAVRATLSVTSGFLNATAGTTGVAVTGSGTATVTLDGTLSQINNLLAGNLSGTLTYTANGDAPPPSATLTLTASDLGNTGSGGTLTGIDTATINITAVNDSPTIGGGFVPAIVEDSVNPSGQTISAMIGGTFSDPDAGASLAGILVTNNPLNAAQGTWQYSTDGGSNWFNVGAIAFPNSLALDAATRIRFLPAADYNGSPDILSFRGLDDTYAGGFTSGATRVTADASSPGGSSPISSSLVSFSTTVAAVNDAPTATITPATYAATEQVALTLHGSGLSIADIDAGAAAVRATVSVTSGILSAAAGTTGVTVTGSGTATVTLDGTLTQINNLLAGNLSGTLSYTANSDTPAASATLTLTASDLGNTGTGGTLIGNDTAVINISAVNDAPTATITPVSYAATEQVALSLHGTGLVIADVDAGGAAVRATVSVVSGVINATAGTSGVTIGGNGTATVTLDGTLTQINNLLAGNLGATLTYTANSDTPAASDTLTLTASDLGNTGAGGTLTGNDTATINISAVNDAPVNTVPGAQTVDEDTALAIGGLSISDVDAGGAGLATQLTVANGTLNVSLAGGAAISAGANGSNTLTLSGTQAQINAALATLTYQGNLNFSGSDSLQIVTNDQGNTGVGGALSDTDTVAITVNAINDAPTATIVAASYTATEQVALTLHGTGLSIADIDAGVAAVRAIVSVTNGVLNVAAGATGVIVGGSGTGTVTLDGTLSQINNLLAGNLSGTLIYTANSDTPATSATLILTASDLGNTGTGGTLTGNDTATINIAAVNDQPSFVGLDGAPVYTENAAPVVLDSNVTIVDAERTAADNFNGATLTLARSGGANSQDIFSATGTLGALIDEGSLVVNGVTIGGVLQNANGVLILLFGPNATNALVNQAMQQIAYSNTSDAPPASVQIDWTFNDGNTGAQGSGGALTAAGSTTISITAVNDAPTATIVSVSYAATEQVALTLHGTGLSIADVDAGAAAVRAILSVTSGILNATAGTTGVSVTGSGTSTVTLDGTLAQINSLLAGNLSGTLTYTANSDSPAVSATLTLTASDLGNTGTGGILTGNDTATINISAVNDAPVNTVPGGQIVNEDTALAIGGLNISDVDAGGAALTTQLTVANGTLNVSLAGGANISAGANGSNTLTLSGTQAQINAALATLSYQGNLNFNGSDSLQIVTSDLGNAGAGGTLTDTDTVAITVNAVNDAPVNTVPGAQTVNEDTPLAIGGISVNDVDGNFATTQLTVSNGTLNVSLVGGATISAGANGSNTVTLSGTQAQINAALATLIYQGNLDFTGADTLTVLSSDGNAASDSDTVAITVTAQNDAPVNTVPGAQTVNEDTPLAIAGISVNDVDGNLASTQLSVGNGALNVNLAGGAVISAGANGSSTLTLSGTQTQINAALATVSYQGGLNFNGGDTLTVLSTDGSGATDSDTVAITVAAQNDAPVNTVPGAQTVNEDTPFGIAGISINDVDVGGAGITTQLTVANGTLNVSLAGGASISAGANGSNTLTLAGAQVQINAALATLSYQGNLNFNGTDSLQIVTSDLGNSGAGGVLVDTDTVAITVTAVNDAPTLTFGEGNKTFTEGTLAVMIDALPAVNDVDSANFDIGSLTVTLSANASVDDRVELLNTGMGAGQIGVSGVNVFYGGVLIGTQAGGIGAVPFVVTFNANADASIAAEVMANIRFWVAGDSPSAVARTVDVVLTDGDGGTSAVATKQIAVVAVNDAPVITPVAPDITFVENGGPQVIDALGIIVDVDSPNFDGGALTVSITQNASIDDRMTVGNFGVGAGQIGVSGSNVTYGGIVVGTFSGGTSGSDPLVVTLNANATQAAVQELYRSIQFSNVSDHPATATREITFGLTDGDGGTATPQTKLVFVAAVNDAPLNTLPGVQAVNEDTPLAIAGLSIGDVDAGGSSMTSQLTVSSGTLNVSLAGGASISAGANGSNTLTLSGTQAQINAALATLSYQGNLNFNGSDGLQIVTSDLGNTGSGGTLTDSDTVAITVNAVNDASVNTVPGAQTVNEDTLLAISGISVNDVDGNLATTQLSVTNGTLNVSLAGGAAVSAGANGSNTLTLSGTQAQINAALATVSYQGNLNFNGADTLTVLSTDGNGATDGDVVAITVTAQNDAPVNSVPGAQVVNEDTPLAIAGLSIGDIDAGVASLTSQLTVSNGTLNVSLAGGASISAGVNGSNTLTLSGTQAQINAALSTLVYQGNLNFNGTDSFQIVTSDLGNSGAGGVLVDTDTVAITVNATNDAPSIAFGEGNKTFTEGALAVIIDALPTVNDVDSADFDTGTLTVTLSANASADDRVELLNTGMGAGQIGVSGANVFYGGVLIGTQAGGVGVVPFVVKFNANADANVVAEVMANVRFWVAGDAPSTAARTIEVVLTDGDGGVSLAASKQIAVVGVNDAPVTTPVALAAIAEDSGARLITQAELLANASDVDGPALTATGLGISAGSGALVDNGDGTWTYTPALNDDTSVSFSYTVTDGALNAAGSATLDVTPVNDAPFTTPVTLAAITEDGGPRLITQAQLLANAGDIDGPALSATNLTINSGSGTLLDNGNGTWTYTPALNDDTSVSFGYIISDGSLTVAGSATMDITAVNDAPVNAPVVLSAIAEDSGPRLITQAELLANASDIDGPALTATGLTLTGGAGSLVDNGDGTWTYTPAFNDDTSATFSYTVTDGSLAAAGSASLDITPVNDAPVTTPVTLNALAEDAAARLITQAELLANATDVDGVSLTATNLTIASGGGSLVDNGNGTWSYTPAANDDTSVSFSYTVSDGSLGVAGMATLDLTPVNDGPATAPVTLTAIAEDSGPRIIAQAELLANAADIDGPALTASALTLTSGTGTLIDNGNGTWTYTPAPNDDSTVSFGYLISDGALTVAATASLDITPVNDAPVATAGTLTPMAEDSGARVITQAELLANASDIDGPALSAVNLAIASGAGNLVDNGDGTWSYTPALNDDSSVTFSYTVTDGSLAVINSATLDITPVNDAAIIGGVTSGTVIEAGGVNNAVINAPVFTGRLTAADVDNAADTFIEQVPAATQFGTFQITADGTWTYTLDNQHPAVQALNVGAMLSEQVTVRSIDGTEQPLTIVIAGSNDSAVTGGVVTGTVTGGGAGSGGTSTTGGVVQANDIDNPHGVFQPVVLAVSTYGSYEVAANGAWIYILDLTNAAVSALGDGGTLADSFTVRTIDNTPQVVNIAIVGGGVSGPGPSGPSGNSGETVAPSGVTLPLLTPGIDVQQFVGEGDAATNGGDTSRSLTRIAFEALTNTADLFSALGVTGDVEQARRGLAVSAHTALLLQGGMGFISKLALVARQEDFSLALAGYDFGEYTFQMGKVTLLNSVSGRNAGAAEFDISMAEPGAPDGRERNEFNANALRIAGMSLTLGIAAWALRSGGLLAAMMSALPVWRQIDVLPILGDPEKRKVGVADESDEAVHEERAIERLLVDHARSHRL